MKEKTVKGIFSLALAGFSAYFGELLVPLCILLVAMVLDYISGLGKAWVTRTLSSRQGLVGILKKVWYLLVVCVGMVVDWVINMVLTGMGVTAWSSCFVGLLVIVWLIINELLSIIENTAQIGVPIPSFLRSLVKRLKVATETKGEEAFEDGD